MNATATASLRKCEPARIPFQFQTNAPQRIFVVDDDLAIRQLHTIVLTRAGYEVQTAADGATALEALRAAHYDLLLTDHNMPGMSGFELLKELHAARRTLPVIVATGDFPQEDFARHPWLRPAAVLHKPYPIATLLGTVKDVLQGAGCRTLTAPSAVIPVLGSTVDQRVDDTAPTFTVRIIIR